MRVLQIEAYRIDELPRDIQEKAHDNYLFSGFEYHWIDEGIDSVKAFLDLFGLSLDDWCLDTCGHSFLDYDRDFNPRRIKLADIPAEGCPLTGYCVDDDGLIAFHEHAKKCGDIKGAIAAGVDAMLTCILADMMHQESLDYFIDHALSNEFEFDANGNFI